MNRPYVNRPYDGTGYRQYPMKMIGHHHPLVQLDFLANCGGPPPFLGNDFAGMVQPHLPIHDIAEQAFPVLCANGQEIGPRLGIIISPQPDGAAVVCFRVVRPMGHGFRCRVRGDCICADGAPIHVNAVMDQVNQARIYAVRVQSHVNTVQNRVNGVQNLINVDLNCVHRVSICVNRVQSCVIAVPNRVIGVQSCVNEDRNSVDEVPSSDDGNRDGKHQLDPRFPDISGTLFLGRFGFFLLFGLFETLAQLFGHGFEARRGLGGGLDVGVDLGRFLHGLAAHGDAGVVHLGVEGGNDGPDVGEGREEIHVFFELGRAEIGGKDARMVLGGIEGVLNEGDAVGAGLEEGLAFLGGEVDQKEELFEDGVDGGLDGLDVGGGEVCIDVLIGHGCLLTILLGQIISAAASPRCVDDDFIIFVLFSPGWVPLPRNGNVVAEHLGIE